MRQWRLLHDKPMIGQRNMAIDDALLSSVAEGRAGPTLRLYAWRSPVLSLGYAQRTQAIDFERVKASGWGLVRRPTGGRALLHVDELTYSVVLPVEHELARGGVVESCRRISAGLLLGLQLLGVDVSATSQDMYRGMNNLPVCFEIPSHYEIMVGGRKLVGSAQARRRGAVLQHGSLPLAGDVARICDALVYADTLAREQHKVQLRERAITLAEALGKSVNWGAAADALRCGFEQAFGINFGDANGSLTRYERERAQFLENEIYTTVEWRRVRS